MELAFPIKVIVTLIAALGFALFFNVNKRHVLPATLGGVFTWTIDFALMNTIGGVFVPCVIASVFAAVYAETLARVTKTPVAVFFIISVIPLIPGRALYYTMYNAVSGDISICLEFAVTTMLYAGGIAVGLCLVTAVVQTWDAWMAEKAKRLARLVRKQTHANAKSTSASNAAGSENDDGSQGSKT